MLRHLLLYSSLVFLVAMATSLEKSKKLNEVNKPLHPSTIPEILVKIGPLRSELPGRESRPLKNKEKISHCFSCPFSDMFFFYF